MDRNRLIPRYASGEDVAMEVAGVRFTFGASDFRARVGAAALRLGVVARDALGECELEDLVSLTARGAVEAPASGLGAHLAARADAAGTADGGADLVHWLRRLVFRGAWLDAQIAEGWLEPVFDERRGFRYRSTLTGRLVPEVPPAGNRSAAGHRPAG